VLPGLKSGDHVKIRVSDRCAAHQREGSVRYTAAELIEEEAAILMAMDAADPRAVIPLSAADTESLSVDQAAAITALIRG